LHNDINLQDFQSDQVWVVVVVNSEDEKDQKADLYGKVILLSRLEKGKQGRVSRWQ
jgi:hypothetical protein